MRIRELHFEGTMAHGAHGLRFLGPTVRGALGLALKRVACQVSHGDCGRCALIEACAYPRVFEGRLPTANAITGDRRLEQAAPQPFVLLCPSPHVRLDGRTRVAFGIRLFGPACDDAPYIIEALRTATSSGFGPRDVPLTIERITDGAGQVVWDGEAEHLTLLPAHELPLGPAPEAGTLRVTFVTPMSLRADGKSRAFASGLDLVLAGRRRWSILRALYDGPTESFEPAPRLEAEEFLVRSARLEPFTLHRRSGRSQQRADLHAFTGDIVISGPWDLAGDWMRVAPFIHVGKHTSFGFGAVAWEQVS